MTAPGSGAAVRRPRRMEAIARAVLLVLLTVSMCGHLTALHGIWSVAMTLLCATLAVAIWRDPCGKWTQRGLMVFAIGVAIRHSFAMLAGGGSCGCFGPDLSVVVELYLVGLFLVASAIVLGPRPRAAGWSDA
ncbi:MAG: hypothetical protein ACK58T_22300 [Phycisphaerae bacterium]|jgi:hypothetical protein